MKVGKRLRVSFSVRWLSDLRLLQEDSIEKCADPDYPAAEAMAAFNAYLRACQAHAAKRERQS